jgi:hypothetical protein
VSLLVAAWLASLPPRWNAPPPCPDEPAFQARVVAFAGRAPGPDEVLARATVTGGPPWVAVVDLELEGVSARRELAAAECDALADAVALVVAVTLDPVVVARTLRERAMLPARDMVPGPIDEPVRDPVDTSIAPQVNATPVVSQPRSRRRPRPAPVTSLLIGAGGELGAVPGGTGGFAVGATLMWPRARIEAIGRYWIRRRDRLASDGGADVELGTAGLRGCAQLAQRRLFVPLCAGAEAGGLVATGFGLPSARRAVIPWLAGTASATIGVHAAPPVALWAGVELAVPILRPRVTVATQPTTELHVVAPVSGRLLGGVEFRLTRASREGSGARRR